MVIHASFSRVAPFCVLKKQRLGKGTLKLYKLGVLTLWNDNCQHKHRNRYRKHACLNWKFLRSKPRYQRLQWNLKSEVWSLYNSCCLDFHVVFLSVTKIRFFSFLVVPASLHVVPGFQLPRIAKRNLPCIDRVVSEWVRRKADGMPTERRWDAEATVDVLLTSPMYFCDRWKWWL